MVHSRNVEMIVLQELRGSMLRSFNRGLSVVKPTWVLDSVAASKLLSWIPYQLDQLATENNNQPKLYYTGVLFQNSRLQFIGTWRNRYRKRFHGLSDDFK